MSKAALGVAGVGLFLAVFGIVSCGPKDNGEWLRDIEEMALAPDGATFVSDHLSPEVFGSVAAYSRAYETTQPPANVVSFYDDALASRGWAVVSDQLIGSDPPAKLWAKGDLRFNLSFTGRSPTPDLTRFSVHISKPTG